jgi:group I intron endonuclease
LSIREKLISRENLDKLIYDVYISKPVMEMVKRVLAGGAPSGIYKITRLKTGEIYIGKSTDVKKRWTEHCKTAFGVGSIAHSILHTTMKKDGIENFTFELLEEVPKDKLTEREKYWITFYDSKNYGLNERNG